MADHEEPHHERESRLSEWHEGVESLTKTFEGTEKSEIAEAIHHRWELTPEIAEDPAPVGESAAPVREPPNNLARARAMGDRMLRTGTGAVDEDGYFPDGSPDSAAEPPTEAAPVERGTPQTGGSTRAPVREPAPAGEPPGNLARARAMGDTMLQTGAGVVDEDGCFTDGAPEVVADTPAEAAFFERGDNLAANPVEAEGAMEVPGGRGAGALGALAGGLGLAGGILQTAHGFEEASDGTQAGAFQGGVDIAAGLTGGVAGAEGLVAGVATLLGGAAAESNPITGTVAGAIAVEAAGEHRGAELGLFGRDAEGNRQGAFQAAWNTGSSLWDGTVAGGVESVFATGGLEVGALGLNAQMGAESMGSSGGLFGTAENPDGEGGTHQRGAREALDDAGQAAGAGIDRALGIDEDSTTGQLVSAATSGLADAAGSQALPIIGVDAVTLANGVGSTIGHIQHAAHFLGGLFGSDEE